MYSFVDEQKECWADDDSPEAVAYAALLPPKGEKRSLEQFNEWRKFVPQHDATLGMALALVRSVVRHVSAPRLTQGCFLLLMRGGCRWRWDRTCSCSSRGCATTAWRASRLRAAARCSPWRGPPIESSTARFDSAQRVCIYWSRLTAPLTEVGCCVAGHGADAGTLGQRRVRARPGRGAPRVRRIYLLRQGGQERDTAAAGRKAGGDDAGGEEVWCVA
jgi:hypothetical protein